MPGVEVHADAERGLRRGGEIRCGRGMGRESERGGEPSGWRFLRPGLVCVVEVSFSIVREDVTGGGNGDGGVVAW